MAEVFASDLPTARRFVLLALADNAQDDTDEAWPSVATICGKTGLGESTVQRHLGALVTEDGLLSRAWRENDSTVYRINRKALRARARARVQTRQTRPAGDVEYEPEGSRSEGGPAAGPVPDRDPGGPAATTRGSRSGTLITREPPGNPSPSGGTTADATSGEQAALGLDVEPTPKPSKGKRPEPEGAQAVVAAYVETYSATHRKRPLGRDIGKIGRDARQMLRDGESPAELAEAARTMGRDGRWNDLARQVAMMRTGGRDRRNGTVIGPAPVGDPGKFDDMPDDEVYTHTPPPGFVWRDYAGEWGPEGGYVSPTHAARLDAAAIDR